LSEGTKQRSENGPQRRLSHERAALGHARAAVACGRRDEAMRLLTPLERSYNPAIVLRAKVQLALLHHQEGDRDGAVRLLHEATSIAEGRRAFHKEQAELRATGAASDEARQLRVARRAHREAELELARSWARIGHGVEARNAYLRLLLEAGIANARTPEDRHIAALAEYRLAELLVDEAPLEAYDRWRRAFDAADERVSPYAALRLATRIGSDQLVTERVERLFHHAMASSDPELFSEAAIELARHLRRRNQFGEASRYLETVISTAGDAARAAEAERELASLRQAEALSPVQEALGRLPRLNARVHAELGPRSRATRVIVVGAGTGGEYLLASLNHDRYVICGVVDDHAVEVPGHPEYQILGRIDHLRGIIRAYQPDEVLLAIPTLSGRRRLDVVKACRDTGTPLRNLPRMHELGIGWTLRENRPRLMLQLREVEIEETIGDERIEIDDRATGWLAYATAVVVGAGALGAELCRRLADGGIRKLVVIDRRESALVKIKNDLQDTREFRSLVPLGIDATQENYLIEALRRYAPAAVFNTTGRDAARAFSDAELAPPPEMIAVNETQVALAVARAAVEAMVPRMIHVSSRRAGSLDDPFGPMKARAEDLVLRQAAKSHGQVHAVVRIGPLLDSRHGPLARMKDQIKNGVPVTIPERGAAVRFVSTARWAELVLHAARLASNGEVLEPDVGHLVVLRDIAEEAIRLRGWYPGEDLVIQEFGDNCWDEPPSPGPKQVKDAELGIFVVERPEPAARRFSGEERYLALMQERFGRGVEPADEAFTDG
jgi:FlaA1/EpsC-like NDP-sugar epimerase